MASAKNDDFLVDDLDFSITNKLSAEIEIETVIIRGIAQDIQASIFLSTCQINVISSHHHSELEMKYHPNKSHSLEAFLKLMSHVQVVEINLENLTKRPSRRKCDWFSSA